MKKAFIVFLVLLLSVSFVGASWIETDFGLKWISGSAVYEQYVNTINSVKVKIMADMVPNGCGNICEIGVWSDSYNDFVTNDFTLGLERDMNGVKLKYISTDNSGLVMVEVNGVSGTVQGPPVKQVQKEACPSPYGPGNPQVWSKLDINKCLPLSGKNICLSSIDDTNEIATISVNGVQDTIGNSNNKIINGIGIITYLPTNESKPWSYITLNTWPCVEKVVYTIVINGIPIGVISSVYDVDSANRRAELNMSGGELLMNVGNSITVLGKTVTLLDVSSEGFVSIEVDGVINTIQGPTPIGVLPGLTQQEVPPITQVPTPPGEVITPIKEQIIIKEGQVCNGCLQDSTCIPFGFKQKGQYCDIDKQFKPQAELGGSCENSYECKSNECSNGECISTANLLQRLFDLLSKIF